MKHIKVYEDFVNEATTSWKKMMHGVRSSETGPWSIVAIQDRKVVGQSIDIRIQDLIPAKYEALKKEFPKAKLHIEDGTGMVVWNESLDVNESFINEDSSMAFLILMQAAIVNGLLIGQMASGGGGSFHPIDDLKDWWKKRKSDKAVKSIIDKIKDDKDVVEFMKLTPSQQRGKFRSLIATKLTDDELEYLNKINRNHFQTESLDVNEGGGTLKVEKEKDGKYYWTFTFKSGKVEKWPNGFDTSAEAQKDFMYRSKHLKEGTYNSSREIAIYDGAEGLTHIEKRGKGYYGYNDEFDFVADDKADLEKKLKSWKYKLISGSIDENATELDEAVKIVPGMGAFYSYTQDHKLIEKIFKEAFKGQEDKLYRANFFNTGAPCIKFELKNQSSWQLVYYPGQVYLEDHGLGSISLYPYGPQDSRYLVFRVGVKGNRRFGDTKMTPAEIKEAATEFKNWVNNK